MANFDFIKNEKIDLSRQDHRDVVIERNKKLLKALKDGIHIEDIRVKVIVRVSFDCIKCGQQLQEDETELYDGYFEVEESMPYLKCSCCGTKYNYDRMRDGYDVGVPKPENKIKKI